MPQHHAACELCRILLLHVAVAVAAGEVGAHVRLPAGDGEQAWGTQLSPGQAGGWAVLPGSLRESAVLQASHCEWLQSKVGTVTVLSLPTF